MSFSNYLVTGELLTEVTADEKYAKQYTGKLERELFDKAVELDPTSKGKEKVGRYVDWIIRNKLFDKKELAALLATFDKSKEKLPADKRDINKLKYDDFVKTMEDAQEGGLTVSKKDKASEDKKQAEEESVVEYTDDRYSVVRPKTEFASQYFGAGADWCTARREGQCWFNNYDRKGELYIIYDKKEKKKYQLFKPTRSGTAEYKDSDNRDFNPFERFDSDLVDWLKDNDFEDAGQITDEQIDDLADSLARSIGMRGNDEAVAAIKSQIESTVDSFQGEDIGNMYDFISSEISTWERYHKDIMSWMEHDHFIDPDDDQNKLNAIYFMTYQEDPSSESASDLRERLLDMDWVYTYDKPIDDIFNKWYDDDSITKFDDIDLDFIERWLSHNYEEHHKRFASFMDDFEAAYKEYIGKLTDENKKELQELYDKVEKKMYSKQGHPELELKAKGESVSFNRYIDNVLTESFGSELYKEIIKDLEKHIPKNAFKGINTHNTKMGGRNNWEVFIPKNEHFPKGLYIHVGDESSSMDAKAKALEIIQRRYDSDDLDFIKDGNL